MQENLCEEKVMDETNNVETQTIVENDDSNKKKKVKECDRHTALLFCVFLGVFGGHKFYEGKIGMGILYLLTAGCCCVGVVVDIVKITKYPEKYTVES